MAEPLHAGAAFPEPGLVDSVLGLRARPQQAKRDLPHVRRSARRPCGPSGFLDVPADAESACQSAGSAQGCSVSGMFIWPPADSMSKMSDRYVAKLGSPEATGVRPLE